MSIKQIGIALLLSGISAGISLIAASSFVPGIVFGFFFGIYNNFFTGNKPHIAAFISFMIVCGIAYVAAFFATLYGPKTDCAGWCFEPSPLAFVLAGILGSSITIAGVNFFVKKVDAFQIIVFVLMGGILALSWHLGLFARKAIDLQGIGVEFISLFFVWQIGMFLLLAKFAQSSQD